MPIPLVVYAAATVGGGLLWYARYPDGMVAEITADTANDLIESGVAIAPAIGEGVLDIVRGLGSAIIEGIDNAYDDTRNKLRGREADVIAGIVVAALSVGTVMFLYYSVKAKALGPALRVK